MADRASATRNGTGAKEQRRRVTMTDVAKAAGCSQATVSFVLNRTPGMKLSQQTRDRVTEA
ncbi:MAG TPA: LacI family DNA-binding transcriptional regulator, partial [Devosia sp.]|nr:LacI family DNA-binding transcriptional regulator [Devosia sp.]